MNSEELERSLRAEFEEYLNDVFGEIKQEISGFQQKLDSEFEEHRARIDAALEEFVRKATSEHSLKESFRESVTEHLRLAKDEGARITATAIAEAEELHGSASSAEQIQAGFQDLRDAIADIASKDSQAEILKALVHHASEHTPRGAFFIVKSEHLVGWRVFGRDDHEEPDVVRELFFPLSANTALGEAVNSLGTVNGLAEGFEDQEIYLEKLGFGVPGHMVAIPLVARGRGVAVLYADAGENGGHMNTEALESLVCVAGLTVELLASGAGPHVAEPHEAEDEHHSEPSYRTSDFAAPVSAEAAETEAEEDISSEDYVPAEERYSDEASTETHSSEVHSGSPEEAESGGDYSYDEQPSPSYFDRAEEEAADQPYSDEEPAATYSEAVAEVSETEKVYEAQESERKGFEPGEDAEPEAASFEEEAAALEATDDEPRSDTGFSFTPAEPADEESDNTDDLGSEYAVRADSEYGSTSSADEFADKFEPVEVADAEQRFEAEVEELYEVSESVEVVEPEAVEAVSEDAFESAVEIEAEPEAAFEVVDTETDQPDEETEIAAGSDSFEYSSLDEEAARAEAEFEESEPEQESPAEEPEPVHAVSEQAAVAETGSPVRQRFGDRNIDLPIEVTDEERQYHNAARRFARLLVSEIRLYNEQKVKEGCESNDLYDRLKEAIDRSREMYEKRVHGPVAERFDYFDYELVNNLAQGDESKLGSSYPGSTV